MTPPPKLYVKVWCPWCVMAQDWLDQRGYRYELIDVEKSRTAYDDMIRLSGQRLTPTLVTRNSAARLNNVAVSPKRSIPIPVSRIPNGPEASPNAR